MKTKIKKFYQFLVDKNICKPLEQVKKEQEIIRRQNHISAAKDHIEFMRTTIWKGNYKNKSYKDFI